MSAAHPNLPTIASSCRVVEAGVSFIEQELLHPLVISSGAIERLTEARARVVVTTAQGQAEGFGSIYLSDLWAWPEASLSHGQRDAALRDLCRTIAAQLTDLTGAAAAHPLELGLRLHDAVCHEPGAGAWSGDIPVLARAMCLSPFDAAIHDATGRALGVCAMDFYDSASTVTTGADRWFKGSSTVRAIAAMLVRPPRDRLAAWVLVGKQDDLERDVRPWWDQHGYRCFKLKLHGRDVAEDVARTVAMAHAALGWGCTPMLSVDTNEACTDADFVLAYLCKLQADDAAAFAQLAYLEQPTARDIVANPHDWRTVAKHKPVLLDEGLTSLDLLPVAVEQGWSGLALKTCKGHSFALVAAAWAYQHGMLLAMQDLTNPGIAAVHAALFAAHVPTINGVELNSPQFAPAANRAYQAAWPGLFDVRGGAHRLAHVAPTGLGTTTKG